jgi:hypothetical protein
VTQFGQSSLPKHHDGSQDGTEWRIVSATVPHHFWTQPRDVILIPRPSHSEPSIGRGSDQRQYFPKLMSRIIQVRRRLCRAIGRYRLVPAACAEAIWKTPRATSGCHACVGQYGRVLVRWGLSYFLLPA